MRTKRRILLAAPFFAVLVILLWKPLRLGEPRYHGKSLSGWLEVYGAGPRNYQASPEADGALRHIGTDAVPYLLRRLHSKDSQSSLKFFWTQSSPRLMPAPIFRNTVLYGATKSGPLRWLETHLPFRFYVITTPPSWDHWQAYLGFQALGPLGKEAIPELVKMAQNPADVCFWGNIQDMKRLDAMAGLADSSSAYLCIDDKLYPGLRFSPNGVYVFNRGFLRQTNAFLTDGDIAACSLAAIGADSVPSMRELLANPNQRLKSRAIMALGMIGGAAEAVVPALVQISRELDPEVRIHAVDALGCIGRQPDLAIPALTLALTDPEIGVKCWAANSLGKFRESATNAIPALLANFAARDYRVKQSAAEALSKISRDTTRTDVIPVLIHDLEDSIGNFRNTALITLGQMKDEPDLVIPSLIEASADADKMIQLNAINMLGSFGPKAKAAATKLVNLTINPDPEVRSLAAASLRKIESGN